MGRSSPWSGTAPMLRGRRRAVPGRRAQHGRFPASYARGHVPVPHDVAGHRRRLSPRHDHRGTAHPRPPVLARDPRVRPPSRGCTDGGRSRPGFGRRRAGRGACRDRPGGAGRLARRRQRDDAAPAHRADRPRGLGEGDRRGAHDDRREDRAARGALRGARPGSWPSTASRAACSPTSTANPSPRTRTSRARTTPRCCSSPAARPRSPRPSASPTATCTPTSARWCRPPGSTPGGT